MATSMSRYSVSPLIPTRSVPWNDDRLIRDDGQIPLGCTESFVDTASGGVVDDG